eukprot:3377107-Rhodomonas_salina.10
MARDARRGHVTKPEGTWQALSKLSALQQLKVHLIDMQLVETLGLAPNPRSLHLLRRPLKRVGR